MATPISQYQYTYGSGNQPNRQIIFFGDGFKIWGLIKGKFKGEWKDIGQIDESIMFAEVLSTSEKVQELRKARQENASLNYPEDKKLSEMTYKDKVDIITHLSNPYEASMRNDITLNPYFEKITKMVFFNPN